jgi:hypothetical protein
MLIGRGQARVGYKTLASITTEDVQQLKSALSARSPKTVNNVLTVLNVLMRTAVEWNVIDRVPCAIKLLRTPRTEAGFYEFEPVRASRRGIGSRAASTTGRPLGRRSRSAAGGDDWA